MDWMELIDWKTIHTGIGIVVAVLGLYWTVLPEEKKYALRLKVGLISPEKCHSIRDKKREAICDRTTTVKTTKNGLQECSVLD